MPLSLTIVTGVSRGLGAAIAEQLMRAGHVVLGLSRRPHPGLDALAATHRARCEQWATDLANPGPVAARLEDWLHTLDSAAFNQARLINNAGTLSQLGPIDRADYADLSRALRVGLEAPTLLTAAFLRGTNGWRGSRKVLNISSGLGRRPMAGSATYCAAKAGLDHLSRSLALDEAARPHGARIVSLAPGVIDTYMQSQLRTADPTGFPDQERFIHLKEYGQLATPEHAAREVLTYLDREDFGSNVIADVRIA